MDTSSKMAAVAEAESNSAFTPATFDTSSANPSSANTLPSKPAATFVKPGLKRIPPMLSRAHKSASEVSTGSNTIVRPGPGERPPSNGDTGNDEHDDGSSSPPLKRTVSDDSVAKKNLPPGALAFLKQHESKKALFSRSIPGANRPPPTLQRSPHASASSATTNDERGGASLRAKALGLHKNLQQMWGGSKVQRAQASRIVIATMSGKEAHAVAMDSALSSLRSLRIGSGRNPRLTPCEQLQVSALVVRLLRDHLSECKVGRVDSPAVATAENGSSEGESIRSPTNKLSQSSGLPALAERAKGQRSFPGRPQLTKQKQFPVMLKRAPPLSATTAEATIPTPEPMVTTDSTLAAAAASISLDDGASPPSDPTSLSAPASAALPTSRTPLPMHVSLGEMPRGKSPLPASVPLVTAADDPVVVARHSLLDVARLRDLASLTMQKACDQIVDGGPDCPKCASHAPSSPPPPSRPFKLECHSMSVLGTRPANEDELITLDHFACVTSDTCEMTDLAAKVFPSSATATVTDAAPSQSTPAEAADAATTPHASVPPPQLSEAFYGVYDGHLGGQASEYTRMHLHFNIAREFERARMRLSSDTTALTDDEVARCMERAFLTTDRRFNIKARRDQFKCGTTALATVLIGDRLHVANVGDGQAVLCRQGLAVELAQVHSPGHEMEKERIKRGGGTVVWYGAWRVNGILAVSRSIGDPHLSELVVADPDVRHHTIDASTDQFMILGSDGLWDVFSPQEAVDFVKCRLGMLSARSAPAVSEEADIDSAGAMSDCSCVESPEPTPASSADASGSGGEEPEPTRIADVLLQLPEARVVPPVSKRYEIPRQLCDEAMKLKSQDNISVVLVFFDAL